MDLDALTDSRQAGWDRLGELSRAQRLTGPETDELIDGYRRVASDLSEVQAHTASSTVGDRLSVTLARARLQFTGAPENALASFARFWIVTAPAALYRLRWPTLWLAVATLVIAAAIVGWVAADPRVLAGFGDDGELRDVAEKGFVQYYREHPNGSFAGMVWTNNAWIAAQSIALGITGLWVPYMVLQNAMNLGITAAVMFHYGQGATFFAFIAPHGLLELTCVFVAGAAGLRVFWAWVVPGARTRGDALAAEGRAMIGVVLATTAFLLVAGLIEGFVTPSELPWWAKLIVGVIAFGGFWIYTMVLGRRAVRAGETGDIARVDAGVVRIASA
ncbi:MAG TPA: stage II sporulation protein M [Candidatus Lumbricidophila sp.]|nr:stage II sporulation protein M [Candidatus Lumbricidophila sp.]